VGVVVTNPQELQIHKKKRRKKKKEAREDKNGATYGCYAVIKSTFCGLEVLQQDHNGWVESVPRKTTGKEEARKRGEKIQRRKNSDGNHQSR